MKVPTAAYDRGFTDGQTAAHNAIWGGTRPAQPDYDTRDEMCDYDEGFEDGYNSVE